MIFYSASTNGFFDTSTKSDIALPCDAVETPWERYVELLISQGPGKKIVSDNTGLPILSTFELPFVVPQKVSMRQVRTALLNADLLQSVDDCIKYLQGKVGEEARISWEYSAEVMRGDSLIDLIARELSLTTHQVDSLFVAASGL